MKHQQQTAFENMRENEKLLVTSNFSFSHNVFYSDNCVPIWPYFSTQIIVSPFGHIFDILSLFAAELEEPKIFVSGKGLKKLVQKMEAAAMNEVIQKGISDIQTVKGQSKL